MRFLCGLVIVGAIGAGLCCPAQAATTQLHPGDRVTVEGVTVTVPQVGMSVAAIVDELDGAGTTLVVSTAEDGAVSVRSGADAVANAPDATSSAIPAAGPPKCRDDAYTLIDGSRWEQPYSWWFRKGSTPDGLDPKQVAKVLRTAADNQTHSTNRCGLADEVSAEQEYAGTTSEASDVTKSTGCKPYKANRNVIEFGSFAAGEFSLAAFCVYTDLATETILGADVRFNTYYGWTLKAGRDCGGATLSLEGVGTHEFGHAFGLDHVDEVQHGNLTMSGINAYCSNFESHLGLGDIAGMRFLY